MRELRADAEGQYNRGVKMNFLAGICGDDANPMRWRKTWISEGTNIERFLAFFVRILDDLEEIGIFVVSVRG